VRFNRETVLLILFLSLKQEGGEMIVKILLRKGQLRKLKEFLDSPANRIEAGDGGKILFSPDPEGRCGPFAVLLNEERLCRSTEVVLELKEEIIRLRRRSRPANKGTPRRMLLQLLDAIGIYPA